MYFDKPTQIQFLDEEENLQSGIAYKDFIICACCGGVFETEEVKIVTLYNLWVNFSETIL